MKLVVRVIEAKNLLVTDPNGSSDLYVRLQLGKQRFKTKVIKKCLEPKWDEEFSFWVGDLKGNLVISVMDEDKFFNDDVLGKLKVPVSLVFDEEIKSLGNAWYSLKPKSKKSKKKECGMLCCCTELSSTLCNSILSCFPIICLFLLLSWFHDKQLIPLIRWCKLHHGKFETLDFTSQRAICIKSYCKIMCPLTASVHIWIMHSCY